MTTAEDVLARARKRREQKGLKTDMERILSLAQTPELDEQDLINHFWSTLRRHENAPKPRAIQAIALQVACLLPAPKGIVGQIGVGHGKTLLAFLLAAVWGCKRPVLLIPPAMREQCRRDLQMWEQHYNFPRPTIVAYSTLSSPEAAMILEQLKPDCIIADEAHCLRYASATRTKRFIRYMQKNPNTRFAALSGTLTSKSVKDYGHLCELALRGGSPLPLCGRTLEIWAAVLDPDGEPDAQAWRALAKLRKKFNIKDRDKKACRLAFQHNFRSTLGVVATREGSVDCSLLMGEWPGYNCKEIREALKKLSETWQLPSGEYLTDAIEYVRAAKQISLGFYYVWEWPNGVVDEEWLEARREWSAVCRNYLTYYAREGRDSVALLERWADQGNGGAKMVSAWRSWKRVKDRPKPPTKAVWITRKYIERCAEYLKSQEEPTLAWFKSRAVGEALQEEGIDVCWNDDPAPGKTHALSIPIHHKGRNYQPWSHNFIIELPSSGSTWEQMVGRTHRQGQSADTVHVTICRDTWAQRNALKKAKEDARYIQDSTGSMQKLCYADWTY